MDLGRQALPVLGRLLRIDLCNSQWAVIRDPPPGLVRRELLGPPASLRHDARREGRASQSGPTFASSGHVPRSSGSSFDKLRLALHGPEADLAKLWLDYFDKHGGSHRKT